MNDYISREAAKKQMRNGRHYMKWLLESGAKTIGDAFAIVLDEVPAADVRPVVLCKDCVYARHREQTTEKIKVLPLNGLTMNGRKIIPALANVTMDGTRTSRSLTFFARMGRGRKADV